MMADDLPKCPTTPSRRKSPDLFPGWITPESAKPSYLSHPGPTELSPTTPQKFVRSPRSSVRLSKHNLDYLSTECRPQTFFLPSPLTVGTGRKAKQSLGPTEPSIRSKNLTAALQSIADDDSQPNFAEGEMSFLESSSFTPQRSASSSYDTPVQNIPSTPTNDNGPILDICSDSEPDIQIVNVSDLHKIPRKRLENPFVQDVRSPPRVCREKHNLDLSTHMETVNNRTGERRVEKLTSEQLRFKPRKLDFTQDVKAPVRVNYNVTNKYIGSSIGKSFVMGEPQTKSFPGFNIFDDHEEKPE